MTDEAFTFKLLSTFNNDDLQTLLDRVYLTYIDQYIGINPFMLYRINKSHTFEYEQLNCGELLYIDPFGGFKVKRTIDVKL